MKRKIISCLIISALLAFGLFFVVACGDEGNQAGSGDAVFNPTGDLIMSEPISITTWIEGGGDVDWDDHVFIQEMGEKTNVFLDIMVGGTGGDAITQRNLMFASGDYPEMLLLDWHTMITWSDVMQYGIREEIIIPVTSFIDSYGVNMQRLFNHNPYFRERMTAPDGEIYGVPRFSECFHCSAYPKMYIRTDWLEMLGMDKPTTTDELHAVLYAFVHNNPAGVPDPVGITGGIEWNTMVEYGIIGMAFQTVVPDFWLNLADDGVSIEISVMTDQYREGLRFLRDLYEDGLIDRGAFSQNADALSQVVRATPHSVGMFVVDHPAMGFDMTNFDESRIYQALREPLRGPTGFQRQPENANEGEFGGFHAVITDAAQHPEAAFRFIDNILLDEVIHRTRFNGPEGRGWEVAPPGLLDIFGNPIEFIVLHMNEVDVLPYTFPAGPQPDIAPMRAAQLVAVEGDDVYLPENYEQRISLDTIPLLPFIPETRLQYNVFVPLDYLSEFNGIEASINSFIRMATVQFIIGDRDIETEWEQYLDELRAFGIYRYLEIYEIATGRR